MFSEGKLERDSAKILSKIFNHPNLSVNMTIGIILKHKSTRFFHSQHFGVAERCAVGFFYKSEDKDEIQNYDPIS